MADNLGAGKRLEIEGAYNVRDIGGYPTEDGRLTRPRTFLRADDLSRLPPSAQETLVDYGVRTVIDLRRSNEVEGWPDVFARSSDVTYHHINMVGDSVEAEAQESEEPLEQGYSRWLDLRQTQIRDILALLADPAARPALYHCAAGKDRTGVISALLLGLGGVAADTIAEDYALTGRYLWDRYLAFDPSAVLGRFENWEQFQRKTCSPGVMLKVLGHLDDRYGGVEAYCRSTGLTDDQIDSLRNAIVE